VELAVSGPFFKEFALSLGDADPGEVVLAMSRHGYLIGPAVGLGDGRRAVLVAATERRTAGEVEGLTRALETVMKEIA
jgi:hypothetical protein